MTDRAETQATLNAALEGRQYQLKRAQKAEAEAVRLRQQVKIALDALGEIVHIGDGCEVEACRRRTPATLAEDALIRMSVLG